MSTLRAWSNVVRLWRSFMASLSSASLRSSIRRSVVSSRLQGRERPNEVSGRKWQTQNIKDMVIAASLPATCSRPEWSYWLLSFASASRWKVQHLYSCLEKHSEVKFWCSFGKCFTYKQLAVCICAFHWVCLTGSFLSVPVSELWQSLLQPVAVLLSALQLCLLLVTSQLQTTALADRKGQIWMGYSAVHVIMHIHDYHYYIPWLAHSSASPVAWPHAHPSPSAAPTG